MHTTDEPDSGGLDPALVAEVDRVSKATIDAWTDPDRIARERAVVRAAIVEAPAMSTADVRRAADHLTRNGRPLSALVQQRSAVNQAHGEIRASVAATAQHLGTGGVQLERRPDPETIDPLTVQRICARVGKRTLYDGPVTAAAGEMLAQLQAHGRQLRVTCWMVDGTKRIYRGNGVRIR